MKSQNMVAENTHHHMTNREKTQEAGFSLIETVIALVILTVALLSVASVFTYSIRLNTGNNARSQALAVLQQETETFRAAKFTPLVTDGTLTGGIKPTRTVQAADNSSYRVDVTIDNDPFTANIQTNENTIPKPTLKEITVTVTPQVTDQQWTTAVPATVVIRRVRGN